MLPRKKFTPFSKLSRHKKRDLYVRLRNKIKQTAKDYGQNFTSDLILNEPGRPSLFNQWFDFYFLGLDGVTIWNTVLYTANEAYWSAIRDLAFKEADRLCPKNENDFDLNSFLIPVYDDITGKKLHYIMKEPEIEPELNNLTHSQFVDEYSSKLIHEDTGDTVPVFESFEIDTTYRYGIGLFAVIDAPEINAETIEAMIEKFRSMGERNWKNPTPVERSKLPGDTFETLAKKQANL
ncbi:MAG: hypothetical protein ACXWT1_11910 [Methylobacter sp.]